MKIGYAKALQILCDAIVLNASPHRGVPPPLVKTDRREQRPHHTPDFLADVAVIKARLVQNSLSEDDCREQLECLFLRIIQEANERSPKAPAYFDLALEIGAELNLSSLQEWLKQKPDLTKWHPYLAIKINRLTPHRS